MSNSLSSEALEVLRRLNEVGVGQAAPAFAPDIAAQLLGLELVAESASGEIEITRRSERYPSEANCD
jgi:hypothetical protein